MVEDVFDNKYPVPRYPYSQTHAVPRRSTQNLPPDPVFVHLTYNAAQALDSEECLLCSVSNMRTNSQKQGAPFGGRC